MKSSNCQGARDFLADPHHLWAAFQQYHIHAERYTAIDFWAGPITAQDVQRVRADRAAFLAHARPLLGDAWPTGLEAAVNAAVTAAFA